MKRWKYHLAAAGVLLLIVWGLAKSGWFGGDAANSAPHSVPPVKKADPMETQSGWRYRQNLPHHWRYIMLQK